MQALLEVKNLRTHFQQKHAVVRAVDGVSFAIERGKTLGLVGESGSGKSVTSLSLMGLVPTPPAVVSADAMLFEGKDILHLDADARRRMRGSAMGMIFQEPMTSLNPVYTVGDQIVEAIRIHFDVSKREARRRAIDMLRRVRIPSPEARIDSYPHEMSGGMRQRVMIGIALACEPKLLIADEPTTALDVTIQAQILELMKDIQRQTGTSILLITHDLGVVAEMADDVAVMYAGQIVESAAVKTLFDDPQHPYTIGLLGSIPRIEETRERLATIEGTVPNPAQFPPGCRFAPRCPFATAQCRAEMPPMRQMGPGHFAACWRAPVELLAAA